MAFLVVLVLFVAAWITLHHLVGLDPDWGLLNLILSIEASFSVALIIMADGKQEERDHKQLAYMQHLLEGIVAVLEGPNVERDQPTRSATGGGLDGHNL